MECLSQFQKWTYSMAGDDASISHMIKRQTGDQHLGFVNIGAEQWKFLNDAMSLTRKLRKRMVRECAEPLILDLN